MGYSCVDGCDSLAAVVKDGLDRSSTDDVEMQSCSAEQTMHESCIFNRRAKPFRSHQCRPVSEVDGDDTWCHVGRDCEDGSALVQSWVAITRKQHLRAVSLIVPCLTTSCCSGQHRLSYTRPEFPRSWSWTRKTSNEEQGSGNSQCSKSSETLSFISTLDVPNGSNKLLWGFSTGETGCSREHLGHST
jgi:hypothetical protein